MTEEMESFVGLMGFGMIFLALVYAALV